MLFLYCLLCKYLDLDLLVPFSAHCTIMFPSSPIFCPPLSTHLSSILFRWVPSFPGTGRSTTSSILSRQRSLPETPLSSRSGRYGLVHTDFICLIKRGYPSFVFLTFSPPAPSLRSSRCNNGLVHTDFICPIERGFPSFACAYILPLAPRLP